MGKLDEPADQFISVIVGGAFGSRGCLRICWRTRRRVRLWDRPLRSTVRK